MPFFANRYNLIPIIVQQHVWPVPLSRFILDIQPTFDHIPLLKSIAILKITFQIGLIGLKIPCSNLQGSSR